MFKKKGGSAFKPKIPSIRSKPAATTNARPTEASKSSSVTSKTPGDEETRGRSRQPSATPERTRQPSAASERSRQPSATPERSRQPSTTPDRSRQPSVSSDRFAEEQRPPSEPPLRESPRLARASVQALATTSKTPTSVAPSPIQDEQSDQESAPRENTGENVAEPPIERNPPIDPPVTTGDRSKTTTETGHEALGDSASTGTHIDVISDQGGDAAPPATTTATTSADASVTKSPTPTPTTGSAAPSQKEGPTTRKRSQRKTVNATEEPKQRSRKRQNQTEENGEPKPRKRRARSLTPQDAENQVVDLQNLKMADLTRDLHIGKKFSRHDELRDRERQRRLKAKLDKELVEEEPTATEEDATEAGNNEGTPQNDKDATPTPTPAQEKITQQAGPQFRIVDGQIVVDQSSLVMDRHARAAAAQAGEDMETIEENDFTRLVTSNSFMNTSKLRGPNLWGFEETELFYRGLSMFGTDFEMISKMFPGKQRRHIKLKFNREEKHNPKRIDAALIGEKTTKMDIDEYKSMTGSTFESVEKIEAEQKKIEEDFEAERKRIADEHAEILRRKKEQLFADDENEAGKKKKKKGRKKEQISYGLNGEPVSTAVD